MNMNNFGAVLGTDIKPGPVGRFGGWTNLNLLKDRPVQLPGKTRSTRTNPDETRCFFFQMYFSPVPFFFYIFLISY
jgi:hypothetical protein